MSDAELRPGAVRADTAHALLHRAARAQADGRAPSAASGVVRDGRLVWSAGRGDLDGSLPTQDTQYRIGSITKTFTAVLVMRLRDEGRLALDDRLDQHVPDTGLGGCTLRALLSHAAGIAAEPPGPWWERSPGTRWPELASALTGDRALDGLHGHFHYSNVGFGLLGRVVERHRGSSWYEALRAEVLDPLGMRRTTYGAEPPHARGFAVHPWADLVLPELFEIQALVVHQLENAVDELEAGIGDRDRVQVAEVRVEHDQVADRRASRVFVDRRGVQRDRGRRLAGIQDDEADREVRGRPGLVRHRDVSDRKPISASSRPLAGREAQAPIDDLEARVGHVERVRVARIVVDRHVADVAAGGRCPRR